MSVHKVEMFTVICDNCKKDIGAEQEYSWWKIVKKGNVTNW